MILAEWQLKGIRYQSKRSFGFFRREVSVIICCHIGSRSRHVNYGYRVVTRFDKNKVIANNVINTNFMRILNIYKKKNNFKQNRIVKQKQNKTCRTVSLMSGGNYWLHLTPTVTYRTRHNVDFDEINQPC